MEKQATQYLSRNANFVGALLGNEIPVCNKWREGNLLNSTLSTKRKGRAVLSLSELYECCCDTKAWGFAEGVASAMTERSKVA